MDWDAGLDGYPPLKRTVRPVASDHPVSPPKSTRSTPDDMPPPVIPSDMASPDGWRHVVHKEREVNDGTARAGYTNMANSKKFESLRRLVVVCFGLLSFSNPNAVSAIESACENFSDIDFDGRFSEALGERLYQRGFYPEAMTAWQCAILEEGDAGAAFRLGIEYLDAKVVERDPERAIGYLYTSAFRGDGRAQFELGTAHDDGEFAELDPEKAMLWYFSASHQDDPGAEFNLAVIYESGVVVSADIVLAYAYYYLADMHGFPVLARESMERLAVGLSDDQLSLAIRTAQNIKEFRR